MDDTAGSVWRGRMKPPVMLKIRDVINYDVHFTDGSPSMHLEDCTVFDDGWAIKFMGKENTWIVPKSFIKMIITWRHERESDE